MYKVCSKCKEKKPLVNFCVSNKAPDKLSYRCRQCHSKYYFSNHEARRIRAQKYNQSPIGKFNNYKKAARDRDLYFLLTYDEFMQFWNKPCAYCGDEILTIGLDRINNNKGYAMNNIVSCCERCNMMKGQLPREEFLDCCQKIINVNVTKKELRNVPI